MLHFPATHEPQQLPLFQKLTIIIRNRGKTTTEPFPPISTMHSTLFPATEALQTQERKRSRAEMTLPSRSSQVDFSMNSLFEQASALDSIAFAPFPQISWSFESDASDTESEGKFRTVRKGKKTYTKFDDLFKHDRRTMRKHSSSSGMVRSKAQFNNLSHMAESSSSLRNINSFLRLTASSA